VRFDIGGFPFFYEEAIGHWGVETDFSLGTCAHCTLSLLENPEGGGVSNAGVGGLLGGGTATGPTVVVFPKCGHAFHNFCSDDDKACVLCLANNMDGWAHSEY